MGILPCISPDIFLCAADSAGDCDDPWLSCDENRFPVSPQQFAGSGADHAGLHRSDCNKHESRQDVYKRQAKNGGINKCQ